MYDGIYKIFVGWSTEKQEDNTSPMFTERQEITKVELEEKFGRSIVKGTVVTLYAVWLTYLFSEKDT